MSNIRNDLATKRVSCVPALLDKKELVVLRDQNEKLMQNPTAFDKRIRTKTDGNATGEITEFANLSRHIEIFRQSSVYDTCSRLASEIFGSKAYFGHDETIIKAPGSNPVDWHQDQIYSRFDKDKQCVAIWVPLQDADPHNGGMEYIVDGTVGLLQHEPVAPGSFMYRIPEHLLANLERISPSLKLGDVCIHTPLSIHRSFPNQSSQTRIAWVLQFNKYGISRFIRWNNLKRYFSRTT